MGIFWSQQSNQQTKKGNKEQLNKFGGYYSKDMQKQGIWIEENQNLDIKVLEMGQYFNGQRIGKWKFVQNDKQIAGGFYNDKGQKKGKWIELWIFFNKKRQVIYNGEYNFNGMKIGRWDSIYYKDHEKEYKQVQFLFMYKGGGGLYDLEGNQKKVGRWVDLDDRFEYCKQITYYGEYNKNGMKVGRWDIMYCKDHKKKYNQVGGGSYDQEGNQRKVGKWVELDVGFCCDQNATYNGEYDMNGMKVGRWDIIHYGQQIGGGSYDQKGNQKKIGKWVELDDKFNSLREVTYKGEYNMNGMKVGRWDIMYYKWNDKGYKQIGGGSYDQEGFQNKIGTWVELDEEFKQNKQVTYHGEYNQRGMKVGEWKIWFNYYDSEWKIKQIGGGYYDKEGNQRKVGKWIELCLKFNYDKQVTFNGQYDNSGMKIGTWVEMDQKRNKKCGLKIYDF